MTALSEWRETSGITVAVSPHASSLSKEAAGLFRGVTLLRMPGDAQIHVVAEPDDMLTVQVGMIAFDVRSKGGRRNTVGGSETLHAAEVLAAGAPRIAERMLMKQWAHEVRECLRYKSGAFALGDPHPQETR